LLLAAIPSAAVVTVKMVGISGAECVAWQITALVAKDTALATTLVVGTPVVTVIGGTTIGLTTANPVFVADITLGGYAVTVAAPDANTWHWNARIDSVTVA
jgi:hypothetical protein